MVGETSHLSVGAGAQPPGLTLSWSMEQSQGKVCHRDVASALGRGRMRGPLGAGL